MLVFLMALFLVPVASSAATYHVSNSGSDTGACGPVGQPCQTYEYVRANKLQSGDTLYFRAGSYPEIRVTAAQNIPSGTSSNRTIIAGFPGEFPYVDKADVIYNDVPGNPSKRGLTQYVTFQNFKASFVGSSGCQQIRDGIDMTCGGHFIRFQDLEVTNDQAPGSCVGGAHGSTHLEYINMHVHHCGGGSDPGQHHGFYACSPDALYDGNNVHDNSGYGMQIYESGFYYPCGSGAIFRNNYVHHNFFWGAMTIAHGDNIQFYNNVIAFNKDGAAFVYSGDKPDLYNLQIYNNTFYNNEDSAIRLGNTIPGQQTIQIDPKVRNNIFIGSNISINEISVQNPQYTNNLCPSLTTGCTHTGNPDFANPSNPGSGCSGGDPTCGFKINQGSVARNQGASLSTFSLDKAGLVRSSQGTQWDIGAYEYPEGGGQAFDFLVPKPSAQTLAQGTSITFPVTATLAAGTSAPVTFSVTTLPSGVSASFTGNPCTPTCTANLTLTATGGAPVGTYTTPLLVGTSGSTVRNTNFDITVVPPSTGVKAFPTAEGFGAADTVGGRNGVVMEITKLTDDGSTGTFRWCAEGTGARTCVFRVGGVINLASAINIVEANSFLTIAGQTAPGEGITLTPWPISISYGAHDVIIRHLRHRQAYATSPPNGNNDCGGFLLYGASGFHTHHIVLDHVSTGYTCDDSMGMSGYVSDSTIQWSIVADPYESAKGDPYGSSKGMVFGGNDPATAALSSGSMHHNMLLHANSRAPAGGPQGTMDFRYNLIYNWGACTAGMLFGGTNDNVAGSLQSHHNFVGNRYIAGPDTQADFTGAGCWLGSLRTESNAKVYVQDNVTPWCGMDSCPADTFALGWGNGTTGGWPASEATFRVTTPYAAPAVIATARSSMESMLATKAGATVPFRDALDARVISEMQNGTGNVGRQGAAFPTVANCNGVSTTPPCTAAPTDTDHDGMPDAWETSHGLNPNLASDRNGVAANGYTNLENYLNELAGDAPAAGPVFDFSIANPGPKTLSRGAAITVPLTLSLFSGTAGPVSLSVTEGLPTDVTASFTNNPCTPPCTSQLTLTASSSATVGTTLLRVTGTGGGQAHDTTFNLTVSNIMSTGNPIYVRKGAGSPTNSCTAAENQATAKQSVLDACQCMIVPGKVMYIEGNGNTYIEMVDTGGNCPITGGNGPSYDTATRLEGYGAPLPTIQAPTGADMALHLRGSGDQYLIMKKLVFDGANQAPNAVAVFSAANHVRFEEVEIKNTTGGNFEPFYLLGASNIELIDVFIHDAGTQAMTLDGSVSSFLCRRCHFFSAGQKGVNVTSTGTKTSLTFEAPEVRNNGGDGIDLGSATGTTVENMINHSNGGIGLRIRSGSSGTRSYNNTIYGNTGVGLQCDAGATTTELRNNIVYGNTAGNILNNCGATVARNLCAISSSDCALGGDPLFVSAPTNLHLADGSPGIDAGETIPSLTTDYSGNARQQGGQDIGAYERTQAGSSLTGSTEQPCNLAEAGWFL